MHRPPAHRSLALLWHALLCAASVSTATLPPVAFAQAPAAVHEFDIPAGPLAQTLNRIGEASGLLLSFDPALVSGRLAPAVKGRLSPAQALEQALAGSGLVAVQQGESTVIRPAPPPVPEGALVTELPEVKVVAGRDIALRADHAPSTTKGRTPLLVTPMSVQVVPQALIEDRQADGLRDALQTISGVFPGATSLHEDVIVRGFYVDQSYRNGVRTFRFGPTEIVNAERIDVLKGPSSTQFGRGDISGMFNVVTKKAEPDQAIVASQQVGSHRFLQTTVDATGPIDEERQLSYRAIGAYEHADSFRDRVTTRRSFLAPSFSWTPSAATRANVEFEFAHHDTPIDRGIPAVGDRPADVPRGRNYSEPDAFHINKSAIFAFDWSHRLNDTWALRQNFMLERGKGHGLEYQQARAVDFGINDPESLLRLPRLIRQRDVATEYTSLELAGAPEWGAVRHDLVVGIDVARSRRDFDFLEAPLSQIELLPIYDFSPTGAAPAATEPSVRRRSIGKSWGLYAQDQIRLGAQWHLMLGGRYDDAREESIDLLGTDTTHTHDKRFSPRVGVVHALDAHKSLYASFTESFSQANGGRLADGSAMKPITAAQYELGFKAESADKRVFTTIALYSLTKQNIVVPDPNDVSASVQLGRARSRGLEWDLGGRITSHWNLTGSYSYTDARVTRDTDASKVGRRLYGVPLNSAKAFARYDRVAGGAAGWSLGGGVVALGPQYGDVDNTFRIPGYARVDAMAGYKLVTPGGKRVMVQLNIENVTDKTYHLPSGGAAEIAFGRPRSFKASLKADF
jgi:iron complex outermembrane receptor protein